jgi:hypothetical protein
MQWNTCKIHRAVSATEFEDTESMLNDKGLYAMSLSQVMRIRKPDMAKHGRVHDDESNQSSPSGRANQTAKLCDPSYLPHPLPTKPKVYL